jgi:hypothetical protein
MFLSDVLTVISYKSTDTEEKSSFSGLVVGMLASGTQIRGFKPG